MHQSSERRRLDEEAHTEVHAASETSCLFKWKTVDWRRERSLSRAAVASSPPPATDGFLQI